MCCSAVILGIKLATDNIGPPTALGERSDDRQTEFFKLVIERLFVDQASQMNAVKIDQHEAVRIALTWFEQVTWMPANFNLTPRSCWIRHLSIRQKQSGDRGQTTKLRATGKVCHRAGRAPAFPHIDESGGRCNAC